MAYRIHVFLKSSSFSEEYAQEHHQGKDSLENVRFEWEDEFRINGDFSSVDVQKNSAYTLEGELPDGNSFAFEIKPVIAFDFHEGKAITRLVFSTTCLDDFELDEKHQVLKVYLNDNEAIENPIPGVYLTVSDFPKALQF
jgi:hypothetical protein